ncbi:MAG: hypothetical protein FJ088_05840 [Deltaproteobacteria bacterium]|nr:hypothetical protein [Deltaproteobacteria bacterium]
MPRTERFAHVDNDFVSLLFASVSPEPSNRPDALKLVERLKKINAGKSLGAALVQNVRTLSEAALKEKKTMSAEELGEETTDKLGYDDITLVKKVEQ